MSQPPNDNEISLPWPSVVGSAREFVVEEAWPSTVKSIHMNFFKGKLSQTPRFDYPRDEPCSCSGLCVGPGGSSCVNFRTNTLCDSEICENDIGCGNRFIETYPLLLIDSACGLGVASTKRIPKYAFVAEYVGELIDEEEKERRDYPDYTI